MNRRLDAVYQTAPVIPFDASSKLVLMSDCHRGQGNNGDNFLKNQNVFFGALEYYYQNGFTYFELGDGDELWENRNMSQIVRTHSDAFWLMSKFYQENRLYMLYGNHDLIKSRKSFVQKRCQTYECETDRRRHSLFPNIKIRQGLILENQDRQRIFLVHGHQGDLLNDRLWPLSKFLVRYVWRPLELVGVLAPTGAGRPNQAKDKIEKRLTGYARQTRQILIAGHTHRPVFPKPGEGLYFNDGSCVHPRCITAIEIETGRISLVKWYVAAGPDRRLFVARQILEGPAPLSSYYLEDP